MLQVPAPPPRLLEVRTDGDLPQYRAVTEAERVKNAAVVDDDAAGLVRQVSEACS